MRVLLVDDNLEGGFTLKELLELKGFEVEYVENGYLALNKFKENNFDLVIMDIVMPGIDGIEIFKKMKEIKKDIKVIFLSAFIDEKRKEELKRLEIRDFLEKPFNFQELLFKIEGLIFSDNNKEKKSCEF